ncbi:T9SS type B sorting domain-containing protein [Runella sp.]|uniref:T9SS type B sorting domain-containing protein n=1 Tax=Runella sp. TaxID=1960881 RepID=UPI003D0ACA97
MLNYLLTLSDYKFGCDDKTTVGKDTFFDRNERRIRKSMKFGLLLSLSTLLIVRSYAQQAVDLCLNASNQAGFNIVGPSVGCMPFEVKVEKTSVKNENYIYDYKGGNIPQYESRGDTTRATSFKYNKTGIYKILQYGSGDSNSGSGVITCKTVEVLPPPNFTAKACSNRAVQVIIPNDSTTQRYTVFIIEWESGVKETVTAPGTYTHSYGATTNTASVFVTGRVGAQLLGCSLPSPTIILNTNDLSSTAIRKLTLNNDGSVAVLIKAPKGTTTSVQASQNNGTFNNLPGQVTLVGDTTTITIKEVNALKDTYCFRLNTNDGCVNNSALLSNVVCATTLEVKAENRQNVLTWKEYPNAADFQNYRLTRNLVSLGGASVRTNTTQTDANVTCGEQYCYQVTVQLAGGAESVSPSVCVKAISTEFPSIVQNAFVTVEDDNKISIYATPPASGATPSKYKTIITRAVSGSADFKEVASLNNAFSYSDASVDPTQQSYCYQIVYENSCGNRSQPTEPLCTVYLYSKSGSTVDWTPETPFLVPVNRYQLEILDEQGNPYSQVPVGGNTSYSPSVSDQQLFRYRILAYAQGTGGNSYSNYFVFKKNALVFIPDAFSPNGDGVNDAFAPKGQFVDKSRMIVYNRWGQVLFETDNAMVGWDGTINGQPAVEGTYVFRVEITDSLGASFVKTGTVLLAR